MMTISGMYFRILLKERIVDTTNVFIVVDLEKYLSERGYKFETETTSNGYIIKLLE